MSTEGDAQDVPTPSQADPAPRPGPPTSSDDQARVAFLRDLRLDIEKITQTDRHRVSELQNQKRILFWINVMVVLIAVVGVGIGLVLWVTKGTEPGSIAIGLSAVLSAALLPVSRLWRRLSDDEAVIQERLLERTRFSSVVRLAEGITPHQREKMLGRLAATYTQLIAVSSPAEEDTSSNELTGSDEADSEEADKGSN